MERIRSEEFPSLPSRKDCLFVIPGDDDPMDWAKDKYRYPCKFALYELRLSGELFISDTNWFETCGECFIPYFQQFHKDGDAEIAARSFWEGKPFQKGAELREGLFYGKAVIQKVIFYEVMGRNKIELLK